MILIVLIIVLLFNASKFITGKIVYEYDHSWTKAICNETHCQDYQIFCKGDKLVRQTPLSGAVIELRDDWKDERNYTDINRVCE